MKDERRKGMMDMRKNIPTILALTVLLIFCCCSKKDKELQRIIDATVVNKERIANLASLEFHDDVLLFDRNGPDTTAVIIARPTLVFGLDLKDLSRDSFEKSADGDTIFVTIPPAQVIHFICNPQDREIISADKGWDADRRMKVMVNRAREAALRDAYEKRVVERATQHAIENLNKFLSITTDKVISVRVGEPETQSSLKLSAPKG